MAAATLSAALLLALVGCTPPAPVDPTPTPTSAFATEEEAFAAAEETYRAYVDALNQVDLSDPKTFEAVFELTTGEANASDRKTLSGFHADSVRVTGESVVTLLEPVTIDSGSSQAVLAACVDVSAVDLKDSEGNSIVSSERPDMQITAITLERVAESQHGFLISDIAGREDGPPC
ncbi:hypothetical protein ACFT30_14745 [Microbacterium ureisolvens]|uniref:hypothetical protein n=1 Tax=Microbacterium ureisolvens TaxID=2781186 RepID=UPI003628C0E2